MNYTALTDGASWFNERYWYTASPQALLLTILAVDLFRILIAALRSLLRIIPQARQKCNQFIPHQTKFGRDLLA